MPQKKVADGFAGIDSQGLEGLEWGFDSFLRGPEVTLMLQHDAYGRTLWQEVALESARKAACGLRPEESQHPMEQIMMNSGIL